MWIRTISSKVTLVLAGERRRIASAWRFLILTRRICTAEGASLPGLPKAEKIIRHLISNSELEPIAGVQSVYKLIAPFANLLPVATEHIVQEANPKAVFCHWTALSIHGLTHELPKTVFAYHFKGQNSTRIPLGTTPDDWLDLRRPRNALPKRVEGIPVDWTRSDGQRDFGHTIATFAGLPIYVTDLERTLLDTIRFPEKAGGILNALRAWRAARDRMAVDALVGYAERFDNAVLLQRTGFLLEELKLDHRRLASWRKNLQRGGSMRLVASRPYASAFSERWNLSINVPDHAIAVLHDE